MSETGEGRWNTRGEFVPEFPATSDADPASTSASGVEGLSEAECSTCGHRVRHHEPYPYLDGVVCKTRRNKAWCDCPLNRYEALLASDWLRDREAAAANRGRAEALREAACDLPRERHRGKRNDPATLASVFRYLTARADSLDAEPRSDDD